MKRTHMLLAGSAALVLTGGVLAAHGQAPQTHEMTIRLPGGAIEYITYTGNPNLHVSIKPAPGWADPLAAAFAPMTSFWPDSSTLNRISAQMDQEMNAMLARAQAMRAAAQSGQLNAATVPPGTISYQQVTTWSGNGVCTRIIRMTEPAAGGHPQYVSNTTGDCGNSVAPPVSSGSIQAKAQTASRGAHGTRI